MYFLQHQDKKTCLTQASGYNLQLLSENLLRHHSNQEKNNGKHKNDIQPSASVHFPSCPGIKPLSTRNFMNEI